MKIRVSYLMISENSHYPTMHEYLFFIYTPLLFNFTLSISLLFFLLKAEIFLRFILFSSQFMLLIYKIIIDKIKVKDKAIKFDMIAHGSMPFVSSLFILIR